MKIVIALAILCSAAYAHADDCKTTGEPLLAIDQLDAGKTTSFMTLYRSGAWNVGATKGCAPKLAAAVQALVARSTWKISHPIHCEMMTTKSTTYTVEGKLVFTERACNPDQLDDASAKNLAEIVKLVAEATTPPSCKPEGDVVFERAKKANAGAKVQTSTTRVYATGAWTFAEREADGSAGTTKSGCVDKDTLARLADDVKTAPWTVTIPRVRCMARSQTFVEYSAHGKTLFEQQVCGKTLDQDSANKLADIEAVLTKL